MTAYYLPVLSFVMRVLPIVFVLVFAYGMWVSGFSSRNTE